MAKFNQKKELGKGIRALLGDINNDINDDKELEISNSNSTVAHINYLPLDRIEVNPFQPRVNFDEDALQELSESIKVHGIIQPITVREIAGSSNYQIISGERRWRASHLAELKEVPVYIRTANDQEALEMALIENIQREELNAIEIGVNYQRLLDECELSHETLADRLGKKRATITNYIRLLKLPPDIQVAVREDKVSMGHARALAGIEEIDIQLSIFKEVLSKNLSVRQTEALVALKSNHARKQPKASASKDPQNPYIKKWQEHLISKFSTKVSIQQGTAGNGTIQLPFSNQEDLDRIYDLLSK